MKIKNWFFKKINRIEKPLARVTQEKWEKTKISKIRIKSECNAIDLTKKKKKRFWECYEQSYAKKVNNLDEMGKFWEIHELL